MDYKYLTDGIQHEKSGMELINAAKLYVTDAVQRWMGKYLYLEMSVLEERSLEQRTYKGMTLLHSLLVLGEQFISITGNVVSSSPENPQYVDDETFFGRYPKVAELALEWCRKWGLPWNDDKIGSGFIGFPVMELYISVCSLYQNWILWNAIQLEDIEMARLAVFGFVAPLISGKEMGWDEIKPRLLAGTGWVMQIGAHQIHQARGALTPILVAKEDGAYSMAYTGRDLVQLGFVQLISYIAAGGSRVKRCKVCQTPFHPDRGQEQYCPDCQKHRKAISKRLERQRKKEREEGALNGNHKTPQE